MNNIIEKKETINFILNVLNGNPIKIHPKLDTSYLINISKRNRIAGILYKLYFSKRILNEQVNLFFKQTYINNYIHGKQMYKRAVEVLQLLNDNGVPAILLKGAQLIHDVYHDLGVRGLSDIDILINPKDVDKTTDFLLASDYIQGTVVHGKLVPSDRFCKIDSRLNTHQLTDFVKIEKGNVITIDVNFLYSWRGPSSYNEPQANFNEIVYKMDNNEVALRMHHVPFFIHLCVHMYNEMVFFPFNSYATSYGCLMQVYDIYQYYRSMKLSNSELLKKTAEIGAGLQVWYALKIVNHLFGNIIENTLIEKIGQYEESELYKYYYNNEYAYFDQPILERFFGFK